MELSDEDLESSMTVGQTGSGEDSNRESSAAGSGTSTDTAQDATPEDTSGDE